MLYFDESTGGKETVQGTKNTALKLFALLKKIFFLTLILEDDYEDSDENVVNSKAPLREAQHPLPS